MTGLNRSPGLGVEQANILTRLGNDHGLSLPACLENTNIQITSDKGIDCELNPVEELQIIRNMVNKISLPPGMLGFEAGRRCSFGAFGLIGQAVVTAQNLGQAFELAARYSQTAYHYTYCSTANQENGAEVRFTLRTKAETAIQQFLLMRDLGTVSIALDQVMGEDHRCVESIQVNTDNEDLITLIKSHFQCEVKSGANLSLFFPTSSLEHRMPMDSLYTSRLLESMCYEKITPTATTNRLSEKIRKIFEDEDNYTLSREEAAAKLCMSSRTLARQLFQENTNWRDLVAEIRLEHSKTLLRDIDRSIVDVATAVGFSSSSAFSLAFSRATGRCPSKYRAELKTNEMPEASITSLIKNA